MVWHTKTVGARRHAKRASPPGKAVERMEPRQLVESEPSSSINDRALERHLCARCPSGVSVLSAGKNNGGALGFCCPKRKTKVVRKTKTVTAVVRKTKTTTITSTFTPNVLSGVLFLDNNNDGVYTSPPDVLLNNTKISIVIRSRGNATTTKVNHVAQRAPRDAGCANTIVTVVTDSNGYFVLGFGLLPPGSVITMVKGDDCDNPLTVITISGNGGIANTTVTVSVKPSSTTKPGTTTKLSTTTKFTTTTACVCSQRRKLFIRADGTEEWAWVDHLGKRNFQVPACCTSSSTSVTVPVYTTTQAPIATTSTLSGTATVKRRLMMMNKRSGNMAINHPGPVLSELIPIDKVLHVVAVYQNPAGFDIRRERAIEFMNDMKDADNVKLYVVELAYKDAPFEVTEAGNAQHLQLRTDKSPFWSKENLINIGIKKLLPQEWKAVAWVDMEVHFGSANWALDTLKVLNGFADFVQPFSAAEFLDANGKASDRYESFAYFLSSSSNFRGAPVWHENLDWHPGMAWAANRKAFDQLGGLHEVSILGSADNLMAHAFFGASDWALPGDVSAGYRDSVVEWEDRTLGLRMGYVPGVIRHTYHGAKETRKYYERWAIIIKHEYDPSRDLVVRGDGLLEPSGKCPADFLKAISEYFESRAEDGGK